MGAVMAMFSFFMAICAGISIANALESEGGLRVVCWVVAVFALIMMVFDAYLASIYLQ